MELKLYHVSDGDNVINKTKQLVSTLTINLKRDVNISSPSLILSTDSPTGFDGVNYAEITDLGRVYFVDDIRSLSNKIWELTLSCDVIETYKADILASKARLYRNIKTGDYFDVGLDSSFITTVDKYPSNKSISDKETLLITTVGVK